MKRRRGKIRTDSRRAFDVVCGFFLLTAHLLVAQGLNDGFDPQAGLPVGVVAVQPDGKILAAQTFFTFTFTNNAGLARFNANGSTDTNFSVPPVFNGLQPVHAIAVQEDGRIVIGGEFYTSDNVQRTNLARLLPDGGIDTAFVPPVLGRVKSLLAMPDGKTLVGGHSGIVRLNTDGSIDGTFTNIVGPGFANVQALARQPDGKIVASGNFTLVSGGNTRRGIARLNADGSLDPGFNPGPVLFPSGNDFRHFLAVQPDGRVLATYYQMGARRLLRFYPNGTFDSTFPLTNVTVHSVVVQPDGKFIVGGSFTNMLGQPRTNLARLNWDASLDVSFVANIVTDRSPFEVSVADLAVQPDGKIVVGGTFTNLAGHARRNIGRLYPDGTADATLNAMPNGEVITLSIQPDGRILAGGQFTMIGGTNRAYFARLRADGSVDPGFNPQVNLSVWNVAVQSDERILIGGFFTHVGGQTRSNLARLNADGTLDQSFNPGADQAVRALVPQPDGKILVGGDFKVLGGQPRNYLGRLNPDGTLDESFNPGAEGGVGGIRAMTLQPDGKIIVGGGFVTLAGQPRQRLGRLNSDGTLDESFNPGANDWVRCAVVLDEGDILVAGDFIMIGGQGRTRIARLFADGTVDPTFSPAANGRIWSVAVDLNGRIVVGGEFSMLAGQTCNGVGRLNSDGSLDSAFGSGANSLVRSVAVDTDGKVIVGGIFTLFNGQPRPGIARVGSEAAALQSLAVDSTDGTLSWQRSGAGPHVNHVVFEQSSNGIDYDPLGTAARTPLGWELGGVSLPSGRKLYVRARGHRTGGIYSTASSPVHSVVQHYEIAAPHISEARQVANGAFQLGFTNIHHHSFAVVAATNLANPSWGVVGWPTSIGGGLYRFTDSAATNSAHRYYRLQGP